MYVISSNCWRNDLKTCYFGLSTTMEIFKTNWGMLTKKCGIHLFILSYICFSRFEQSIIKNILYSINIYFLIACCSYHSLRKGLSYPPHICAHILQISFSKLSKPTFYQNILLMTFFFLLHILLLVESQPCYFKQLEYLFISDCLTTIF